MQKVISVAIAVLAILIVFSNTGVATAKDYVFAKWEADPDDCKKLTKYTNYYSGRFVKDEHEVIHILEFRRLIAQHAQCGDPSKLSSVVSYYASEQDVMDTLIEQWFQANDTVRTGWTPGSKLKIPSAKSKVKEEVFAPKERTGKVWDEDVSPETQGKLNAWMDRNDISATGDLDTTLALIIQTALAVQNFDPGPQDGMLGPKTIAAILAWQAMAGWAATGDLAGTLNAVLRTALVLQGYAPDPDNLLFGRDAHKIIGTWGSQHGSALSATGEDRHLWGAFAYSRGRGGWSAGSTSGRAHRAIAVRAALDRCRNRKWGDHCEEILVFSEECGAFAIGRAHGYGVATGRTQSQAERNALSECRRVDTNCQVRTKLSTCNPAVDRFQSESLSDVHVTVPAGQQEVELCVRDHECEDGDRISVSVNGAQVFSGELGNSWSCQQVPVEPGANPISMFAINGTGFKGACGHDNVNTGEMRVTGTSSATQSWRHRGGAGSSARLVVQVQ